MRRPHERHRTRIPHRIDRNRWRLLGNPRLLVSFVPSDAGMIATQSIRNRTHLSITPEGKETLNFFENRIGDTIKQEIDTYFRENEFTLRNEVSVLGDYYKSTSGECEASRAVMPACSVT